MKTCDEFRENILFFDDLSESDKAALEQHLKSCPACHTYFQQINALERAIKEERSSQHVDGSSLARYASYLFSPDEPDYDGQRMTPEIADPIRQHIRMCPKCSQKLQAHLSELEELNAFLEKSRIPDISIGTVPSAVMMEEKLTRAAQRFAAIWHKWTTLPAYKYALIPSAALIILLSLMVVKLFIPGQPEGFSDLAVLEPTRVSYVTRGGSSGAFEQGLAAFNRGEFRTAFGTLETFLTEQPQSPSEYFAHYVCGMAYLYAVQNNEFPANEIQSYLNSAIRHLQAASRTENLRVREDAYWYLGKAYLMKKDVSTAKDYFLKVQSLRGKRFRDAQKILTELEKRLISTN